MSDKVRCRDCGNIEDRCDAVSLGEAVCSKCNHVAFEPYNNPIKEAFQKLASEQKEIDPEIQAVINRANLWDLI